MISRKCLRSELIATISDCFCKAMGDAFPDDISTFLSGNSIIALNVECAKALPFPDGLQVNLSMSVTLNVTAQQSGAEPNAKA